MPTIKRNQTPPPLFDVEMSGDESLYLHPLRLQGLGRHDEADVTAPGQCFLDALGDVLAGANVPRGEEDVKLAACQSLAKALRELRGPRLVHVV